MFCIYDSTFAIWFITHVNSHMILICCHSYTFCLKFRALYLKTMKFWNHGVVSCSDFFHLYSRGATVASSHGFLLVGSVSEFQPATRLHCAEFRLTSQWICSHVTLPGPYPLKANKSLLLWCRPAIGNLHWTKQQLTLDFQVTK